MQPACSMLTLKVVHQSSNTFPFRATPTFNLGTSRASNFVDTIIVGVEEVGAVVVVAGCGAGGLGAASLSCFAIMNARNRNDSSSSAHQRRQYRRNVGEETPSHPGRQQLFLLKSCEHISAFILYSTPSRLTTPTAKMLHPA